MAKLDNRQLDNKWDSAKATFFNNSHFIQKKLKKLFIFQNNKFPYRTVFTFYGLINMDNYKYIWLECKRGGRSLTIYSWFVASGSVSLVKIIDIMNFAMYYDILV